MLEQMKDDKYFLANMADPRLAHVSDYEKAMIAVGDRKRAKKGQQSWADSSDPNTKQDIDLPF